MKNEKELQKLKSDAQATEGDAKGFMNPEPPKARGRGRPRKDQTFSGASSAEQSSQAQAQNSAPTAPNAIPTAEIVKPLVNVVSRLGANFVCPPTHVYHSRVLMTPDESMAICHSLGLVLDKWMPSAMSKFGPEIALSVALGQYGMRLMAAKAVIESEKKKADPLSQAGQPADSGAPRTDVPQSRAMEFTPPFVEV